MVIVAELVNVVGPSAETGRAERDKAGHSSAVAPTMAAIRRPSLFMRSP